MRSAILQVVPDDEGVEFRLLAELLCGVIPGDELAGLGSLSWYATPVKLDLEVKGEIQRIPGSRPQSLRRVR